MSSENTDKGLEMIQAKLDEHKFAFDEQMWSDMEEKLDSDKGFGAQQWTKLLALLFLSPIRLSAILLFTAGTIYFFIKPTAGDNILSENTITTISSSQEITNTKARNTFSTKEENTSKSHTLNTHSAQIIDASKFENKIQKNTKINQKAISNSKKVAKLKVSNEITTLEAYSTLKTEKQFLVANEVKNNNEILFSYAQNSSSSIALAVEEIPSKKIAALLLFGKVQEFNKPTLPKEIKWHWGITGGYLLKKTSFSKRDISQDSYLGIVFNTKIKNKWRVGIGLLVKKMNLDNPISLSFSDILIIPTGRSFFEIKNNIKSLTFFENPVYLEYLLPRSRSSFKFGFQSSFIFKKANNIASASGYNYPNSKSLQIKTKIEQPFYGVRRFNIGILLGYKFQINQRWSVDLDYSRGLTSLNKSTPFSSNTSQRNTDLKLGITYWIK